jgi:hypothetical protein
VRNEGTLTASECWLDGIRDHSDGSAAFQGEARSRTTLSRVSITDAGRIGLRLLGEATARDLAVLRTGVGNVGSVTAAIEARASTSTIERAAIVGSRQYGALVAQSADCRGADWYVAGTLAASAGTGRAIDLEGSARIAVSRVSCESNASGCFVHFSSGASQVADVVVRESGRGSTGLYFGAGTVTVQRARVTGVNGSAVLATRSSAATVSDLTVQTLPSRSSMAPDVVAQNGGRLTVERAFIGSRASAAAAAAAIGARSRLTLRDARVEGEIGATDGGALEAQRARLRSFNRQPHVASGAGSALSITDGLITSEVDDDGARLAAFDAARLELTRVAIEARARVGVTVESAFAQLDDVSIERVLPPQMSAAGVVSSAALLAQLRGRIEARRVRASGAGSSIAVRASIARGVETTERCESCAGYASVNGVSLTAERVRLERVTGVALGAERDDGPVRARGVVRRGLWPVQRPRFDHREPVGDRWDARRDRRLRERSTDARRCGERGQRERAASIERDARRRLLRVADAAVILGRDQRARRHAHAALVDTLATRESARLGGVRVGVFGVDSIEVRAHEQRIRTVRAEGSQSVPPVRSAGQLHRSLVEQPAGTGLHVWTLLGVMPLSGGGGTPQHVQRSSQYSSTPQVVEPHCTAAPSLAPASLRASTPASGVVDDAHPIKMTVSKARERRSKQKFIER